VLVLTCALTACSHAPLSAQSYQTPGNYSASLEHGGFTRSVHLHLPPASASRPLLIVLHGGGSNGREMQEVTGFDRIADREGFVVAYPDAVGGAYGLIRLWNSGSCCGLPMMIGVDDPGFISTLTDELIARAGVNPARVFVAGHSAGGMMALRLATSMSDRFAAAAVYAATLPATGPITAPRIEFEAPDPPISMLLLHSYDDPRVYYAGRERLESSEASFVHGGQFFARAAGCNAQPLEQLVAGGSARLTHYRGCASGREVKLITLYGWDHEWPGPEKIHGCRSAEEPLYDFDAAEEMWRFFADKSSVTSGRRDRRRALRLAVRDAPTR
jgi:polyhydroxybutyrate depolymerase